MKRSMEVIVMNETSKMVTIKLLAVNRCMPVPKIEFEKRKAEGIYEVVDSEK